MPKRIKNANPIQKIKSSSELRNTPAIDKTNNVPGNWMPYGELLGIKEETEDFFYSLRRKEDGFTFMEFMPHEDMFPQMYRRVKNG